MAGHPESELIPYLRDELAPAARAHVQAHLETCAECRRALREGADVLSRLGGSLPSPPALDWGRYRADLRAQVEAASRPDRRWWRRPLPVALSAAVATALVLIAIEIDIQRVTPNGELPGFEEAAVGTRLGLLEQYGLMERLDLLEDIDVINQLDRLPVRDG